MRKPSLPRAMILCLSLAAPVPSHAAWMRCSALGTTESGPREFVTTITEIGQATPDRLAGFQTRLSAYARREEPAIQGVQSRCFAFDDQMDAAAASDHVRDNEARRIGWDHLTVVAPSDWLPASDSGRDIYHP